MYAAPLQGGSRAVVLFNRHVATDSKFSSQNMTVFWKSIGLPPTEQVRRKENTQRSVALRMHFDEQALCLGWGRAGGGARLVPENGHRKLHKLVHRPG